MFNQLKYTYHTIAKKMACRKQIVKQLATYNKKAYRYALPFKSRIIHILSENKKKTIFFIFLASVLYYYGYHRKFYYFVKSIQPFQNKFDRWVLGINNKIPKTIKQQYFEDIELSQQTKNNLLQAFYLKDKKLYFGVGREYLFQIYNQLNLFNKQDEIIGFYVASGYHKERNQKMAGVSAKDFLTIFEQAYKKLKKKDSSLTEENLCSQFLDLFQKQFKNINQKQDTYKQMRIKEYSKVTPNDDKKEDFISEVMSKNISQPLQNVQTELKSVGLQGLSLKDKHRVILIKIMEIQLKKHHLHKKLGIVTKTNKQAKYKQKLRKLQDELNKLQQSRREIQEQFSKYYEGTIY